MECSKCHTAIPDSAKFCPECGSPLADTEDLRRQCLADVAACEKSISQDQGSRPHIRANVFKRLPQWQQAAELGIREAQWLLGRCYDEGFGVDMSEIRAFSWHLRAAEQGYPPAQTRMGSCYQSGSGVPQDEAEAVAWYRKAADQGYMVARSNLGWCYDTGTGVATDEAEAVNWYRKAALQGDDTALYNLGVHYEWGSGVAEDKTEAVKWYRRAAERGYDKAAEALKRLTKELSEQQRITAARATESEQRFRAACRRALTDGRLTAAEKRDLSRLAESLQISAETMKGLLAEEKKLFLRDRKKQRARDAALKFRIACKNALIDGTVSVDEEQELKKLAKSLRMSKEVMKKIFADEVRTFRASQTVAPTPDVEQQLRKACKKALADGRVTATEERELKNLAKFFKISNEIMKQILADEVAIFKRSRKAQPTRNAVRQFRRACKKALADDKVTRDERQELESLAKYLHVPAPVTKKILAHERNLLQQTRPQATSK